LRTRCPDLRSAAAMAAGVTGEGRPTPEYFQNGTFFFADCLWGPSDGSGTVVKLRMSIYPVLRAAEAEWRVLTAYRTTSLPGLGDEAFSKIEPPAVTVRVRSSNVVAVVRVLTPADSASVDRLRRLQPTAAEITRDMLDDLY
jgi:hypothetical protein